MRKAMALLIGAIAVLVLSSGVAQAQTSGAVLDANVPDGPNWEAMFFHDQKKLAQTFVAENSGQLTEVKLKVAPDTPNTTSMGVEIVASPATDGSVQILGQTSVSMVGVPGSRSGGGTITADFTSTSTQPIRLVAGREYAVRLTSSGPGAYWIARPDSVYPRGELCRVNTGMIPEYCASSSYDPNRDGIFAVYVIPEVTDSTPPTITATTASDPESWNNADFDVDLVASDEAGGSGVESTTYSADGAQRLFPVFMSSDRASLLITEEGETTITYSARDHAGNVSPDQTLTVRLDKSEPHTIVEFGPDGPTNDTTPTFTFSGWDNFTWPEEFSYSYRLDDGEWSPYSANATATLGEDTGLEDGSHTLLVRSMDLAGNVDETPVERTFVVDTAPPSANASTSPAPNDAGWHSGDGSVRVDLSALDEGDAGVRGITLSASEVEEWPAGGEFQGDSGWLYVREEGETEITYFATDHAGNESPEQTLTVRIDRGLPGADVTSGPSGLTKDPTPTFRFVGADRLTASEDLLFSHRVDGDEWSPFSARTTAILGGETGLADGRHTFYLRVMDQAGNVGGSFPRDFLVDTEAPDTKIFSRPSRFTDSHSAVFETGLSEPGSAECSLDGAKFSACPRSEEYTSLADGEHLFKVRAVDEAGNVDPTPARARWTVDTASPEGSFEIDGGDRMTRTRMVELVLKAHDPSPASGVSGVRIMNGDGGWSGWRPYASVRSWRLSAGEGSKAVYVQYRDRAGNLSVVAGDTIVFNP